jgi:ribosomal protein S18 acetylase RimI-like enzyme
MLTEIKHLVVHKSFRNIGLGTSLISRAEKLIDTPIIYATIRSKNVASLKLFQDAGFIVASTAKMEDHETLFLIKNNEAHLQISDSNKKSSRKQGLSGYSPRNPK